MYDTVKGMMALQVAWGAPLLKSLQRENEDLRQELDKQSTENRKLRAKLDAQLKCSAALADGPIAQGSPPKGVA